ncbi:MAG: DUF192 domain-containing protein [Ilumatobacteraceae bacterium]
MPEGFATITAHLTEPDGSSCTRCLLLADTPALRSQGLMGVTSLGGYDGMAFRYADPVLSRFWMKDTLIPLDIAFYARQEGDGLTRLARFEMEPCAAESCPTTGPDEPFVLAVETERGRAEALGFTSTARLELIGDLPCGASVEG